MADFTWALATGERQAIPRRSPPRTASGGNPPSARPSSVAPMARNGSTIRRMGRRRSEPSPVSRLQNGRPARAPASIRRVVPEFPASRTVSGSRQASGPAPCTRTSPSADSEISTPSCRRASRVARQSSLGSSPRIVVVPWAMAPSTSARWDSDLSPGTRNVPASGAGPRSRHDRIGRCAASVSLMLRPSPSPPAHRRSTVRAPPRRPPAAPRWSPPADRPSRHPAR